MQKVLERGGDRSVLIPETFTDIIFSLKLSLPLTSKWTETPEGGISTIDWPIFLNTLFWNLNYWDSASSFSGEVCNLGTTYPKAMKGALVLVVLSYILPLLAGIGATSYKNSEWKEGFLENIADEVVGKWLGLWIVFSAGISNVALYQSEMSSDR